jgi:hypothetical protein
MLAGHTNIAFRPKQDSQNCLRSTLHEGVVTLVLLQFKKNYKPKIYKNFASTIMPYQKRKKDFIM